MPAEIYAGAARGAKTGFDYGLAAPDRELRRRQADLQIRQGEEALRQSQERSERVAGRENLELQQLKVDVRKTQAEETRRNTFDAFRRYEADGSTRHLNQFLQQSKNNPVSQRLYGSVLRVDPLVEDIESVNMLTRAGIEDTEAIFEDDDLRRNYLIATGPNGTRELVDMSKLYAASGYTQYAESQELAMLQQRAELANLISGPTSAETNIIEKIAREEGISTLEAAQKYRRTRFKGRSTGTGTTGTSRGTAKERIIQQLMANNPELSYEEALRQAEPTARQKDSAAALDVRTELDTLAGGDFFATDLTDPKERRKYGPKVAQLEQLTGRELTTEDKRLARELRNLLALGKTAGEGLTDEETGPIDSVLRRFRKYVFDNVEGTEATSAYESFRNIFRNALYGASLTNAEIESFNRAAGTLAQQTGPVLAQLRTQVETIRDQMQSIYDLNEEYVSHYYIGTSLDEVDAVVQALDERIEIFEEGIAAAAAPITAETPAAEQVVTDPAERKSLEEIFTR